MGERILCAAIWADDGVEHPHQPTRTGLVFCGLRHPAIFPQLHFSRGPDAKGTLAQGFLTSRGRFVGRLEGHAIAVNAGQIDHDPRDHPTLISEDLY